MSLAAEIISVDKRHMLSQDIYTDSYHTGFLPLDYANGYWMKVMAPDGSYVDRKMLGIGSGSLISLISETGGGKSTLALQIGWNIVKRFNNGMLFMVDCEKTMTAQRFFNLIGDGFGDQRAQLVKADTTIEAVLESFNNLCKKKEEFGREAKYEVLNKSADGKPFWLYQPSVIIIDSLPSFNSEEYNTDNLGTNTDQMRASKDITRFYTNILDKSYRYNCIFIVINHIRQATNMNPYATPPRGVMMLNPMTETLPRGSVPQYYSTNYFRIRTKKSNAYTMKDDGFDGFKSELQIAKSKTNVVGTTFPLAFNTAKGFDGYYTLFEFAKEHNMVIGKNPRLRLLGFDDSDPSFDRKQFTSLMMSDQYFRNRVIQVLTPELEKMLGERPKSPGESAPINIDPLLELDDFVIGGGSQKLYIANSNAHREMALQFVEPIARELASRIYV